MSQVWQLIFGLMALPALFLSTWLETITERTREGDGFVGEGGTGKDDLREDKNDDDNAIEREDADIGNTGDLGGDVNTGDDMAYGGGSGEDEENVGDVSIGTHNAANTKNNNTFDGNVREDELLGDGGSGDVDGAADAMGEKERDGESLISGGDGEDRRESENGQDEQNVDQGMNLVLKSATILPGQIENWPYGNGTLYNSTI